MADGSHIEWTDATWNPLVGCTKVSPGCDNCYAEGVVTRWHAAGKAAFPEPFEIVALRDDRFLTQPLTWTKPRRIFVNSLSDLFHAQVPDEFIARVFAVMAIAGDHTFQLLTKRHARMRLLLRRDSFPDLIADAALDLGGAAFTWPLPNVWLGVSVENQVWADIRIPALLETPAAVRWISAEPLLGSVDLQRAIGRATLGLELDDCWRCTTHVSVHGGTSHRFVRPLDWVVVGGESGPKARPMHPDWARGLRDQCANADVPFLFKQWGNWTLGASVARGTQRAIVWPHGPHTLVESARRVRSFDHEGAALMRRMPKQTAGRELDGRTHDEYPPSLIGGRA